jgi:hypothetical protein
LNLQAAYDNNLSYRAEKTASFAAEFCFHKNAVICQKDKYFLIICPDSRETKTPYLAK